MSIQPTKCCCVFCKKEFSLKGINSHYLTLHTEAGNERIRKAAKLSTLSQKKIDFDQNIRDNNHNQYYLSPKICLYCQKIISYEKRNNNFCGHSCSATYSNKNREPRSEESVKKISQYLYPPKTNIQFCQCEKCNKKFVWNNKTKGSKRFCSNECLHYHSPNKTNIKFCQCELCNKKFVWNNNTKGSKRFCSKECLHTHRSNKARVNPGLGTKRSKDEIKLFELCNNYFNNVTSNEKLFDGWDADILLNDYKIAILWNGPWHYQEMNIGNHSLIQVKNRDKIKKEEIEKVGWSLLTYEDRFFTPQSAFENLLLYIK